MGVNEVSQKTLTSETKKNVGSLRKKVSKPKHAKNDEKKTHFCRVAFFVLASFLCGAQAALSGGSPAQTSAVKATHGPCWVISASSEFVGNAALGHARNKNQ